MMQPAQALLADHRTIPQRTCPASRCLLFQPEMRPVLVIVGDVIGEKSLQMSLVQRDYVVEQLTAAAANPALSHSVLPRTSNRRSHRRNVHRFDGGGYCESILRVVIEYQEPGDRLVREGLSQLLNYPTARRMPTDIEVQDAPTVVADDEKAIQHVEGEGRYLCCETSYKPTSGQRR
jgi:hypothetical protein